MNLTNPGTCDAGQPALTAFVPCSTLIAQAKGWLCLLLLVVLSGCNSLPLPEHTPTLALPMQLHVQREQAGQQQDWLLVIQQEGRALRWSLLDPLGIPQARQRLEDGRWYADGLLPPNPEARELFAALLFALTPSAELADNYPQAKTTAGQRWLDSRWRVEYQQPLQFRIERQYPDVVHYLISPLNPETAP